MNATNRGRWRRIAVVAVDLIAVARQQRVGVLGQGAHGVDPAVDKRLVDLVAGAAVN
jgi:hypothetical protein